MVLGDPTRLRQAIDNLLANIRAHTPAGTRAHRQRRSERIMGRSHGRRRTARAFRPRTSRESSTDSGVAIRRAATPPPGAPASDSASSMPSCAPTVAPSNSAANRDRGLPSRCVCRSGPANRHRLPHCVSPTKHAPNDFLGPSQRIVSLLPEHGDRQPTMAAGTPNGEEVGRESEDVRDDAWRGWYRLRRRRAPDTAGFGSGRGHNGRGLRRGGGTLRGSTGSPQGGVRPVHG